MRSIALLALCLTACVGKTAQSELGTSGGGGGTSPPQKFVAKMIAAGEGTCAVRNDSTVQCWDCGSLPMTVSGITNAIAVAAGSQGNTCAMLGGHGYRELRVASGRGGNSRPAGSRQLAAAEAEPQATGSP